MIYGYVPYSHYISKNFSFDHHSCHRTCSCAELGCTHQYHWKGNKAPQNEEMRYQLATWQAFRNKADAKDRFVLNYDKIAELAKPLASVTVVCDWQEEPIAQVYNQARNILGGSVVLTTKTLHFFLPDLFLILDRLQVFPKWKAELKENGFNTLVGLIEGVDGKKYATFLDYVRRKLHFTVSNSKHLSFAGSSALRLSTVAQLRLASPLKHEQSEYPNTLGKALDNLVRNATYEP